MALNSRDIQKLTIKVSFSVVLLVGAILARLWQGAWTKLSSHVTADETAAHGMSAFQAGRHAEVVQEIIHPMNWLRSWWLHFAIGGSLSGDE